MMWKPYGAGKFRTDEVQIVVKYRTKEYAEDAVEAITLGTAQFFTNRAFILKQTDDVIDMTFWVRHFYEMLMRRAGYIVTIELIIASVTTDILNDNNAMIPVNRTPVAI